jgi:hypothetical protein
MTPDQLEEQLSLHPETSSAALEYLSHHNQWWIRKNVARHPNTSALTLIKMFQIGDDAVVVGSIRQRLQNEYGYIL